MVNDIKKEGLVVFYSTHDSIKAETLCKEEKKEVSLVSTHPDIATGCGFMLKLKWELLEDIIELLEKNGIKYKGLYYSEKIGLKRKIIVLHEN